ncbi:putative uncharacterized protein [Bacteroides sp. CAG:1060]|nr:putative uncharacterized protein [Bacteroides sp. CAG:1060]
MMMFAVVSLFLVLSLYFVYPGSGSGHIIEIKHFGIQNGAQVDVAEVALNDARFWLECMDDLLDFPKFVRMHLGRLVQKDDIAELNLFDNQFLKVIFLKIAERKRLPAAELTLHAQGIHYCSDAVQTDILSVRTEFVRD